MGIGIFHHIGRLAIGLLITGSAHAGEYAVLTNGFRIHADKHEIVDGRVKLFSGNGMSEFDASDIETFEQEEALVTATVPVKAIELSAPQSPAPPDMFAAAAGKHGIPVELIKSVVKAESNFNARAISPKGAIGLMQLMPGTARDLGADPNVPEQNVDAGAKYLRDLLIKYQANDDQVARALAAYNAGPGAVDKYKGVPPYMETQTYVRRVLREYLKSTN